MAKQRIIIVLGIILLGFGIIELKLFSLQVLNGSYYSEQALKRSIRLEIIRGPRGKILDRSGQPLVQDICAFDLFIILKEFNKSVTQYTGPKPQQRSGHKSSERQLSNIEQLVTLLKVSENDLRNRIKSLEDKINQLVANKPPREQKKIRVQQQHIPFKIVSDVPREAALEIASYPERFPGLLSGKGLNDATFIVI